MIDWLKKSFRERIYIISTFPIAALAVFLLNITFFGGGFLPFMILLLLGILTFSEKFSIFEIKRTNKILKSDITSPKSPWYKKNFWSWDGVKERVTSTKAWMVMAYALAAIFFSAIGTAILVLSLFSIVVLIIAFGIVTPPTWNWIYQINDHESVGRLNFHLDSEKIKIIFQDFQGTKDSMPDQLTWVYTSGWTFLVCAFFILLNFLVIPIIANHMKDIVSNLLGDSGAAKAFENKLKAWQKSKKIKSK